jgi:hypothetical protein
VVERAPQWRCQSVTFFDLHHIRTCMYCVLCSSPLDLSRSRPPACCSATVGSGCLRETMLEGRPQQTSNWGSHHLFAHACTCLVQQLPQMIAYSQFLALIWLCACEFLDALSSKRAYFRAPAAISLALVAKSELLQSVSWMGHDTT